MLKQELIYVNHGEYDSQDMFGDTTDLQQHNASSFVVNGRDAMLNQGLVLGPPSSSNWETAAPGADFQNLPDSIPLSQLLGNGLTDSDLATFPFDPLSDSENSLSQLFTNNDYLSNGPPADNSGVAENGLSGLTAKPRGKTIVNNAADAGVASQTSQTTDYRPTMTEASFNTANLNKEKIFNVDIITLKDWEGELNFQVTPIVDPALTKNHCYLEQGNKLFCKTAIAVPFKFELDFGRINDPGDLFIRGSLAYTDPDDIHKPVLRCGTHLVQEEKADKERRDRLPHVLRPSQPHKDTSYVVLQRSKHCFVLSQLKFPEPGTNFLQRSYVFACLSSCKGDDAIGRRPTALMFCLFDRLGNLLGRRVIKVRTCSAPQRDYNKEQADIEAGCVTGSKRKSSSHKTASIPSKRVSLNNAVEISCPISSANSVRCVVTADKVEIKEEDSASSSQETVYSCAESDHKIPLRQLVREVRWALALKRSPDPTLQGLANNVYNALKLTQGLCKSARDYKELLQRNKGPDEKSPDGGFHEAVHDQE